MTPLLLATLLFATAPEPPAIDAQRLVQIDSIQGLTALESQRLDFVAGICAMTRSISRRARAGSPASSRSSRSCGSYSPESAATTGRPKRGSGSFSRSS